MRGSELFHDGWRDPGDDGRRMLYYVSWVLGFFGSLALASFSLRLLLRGESAAIATEPGVGVPSKSLPLLLLALGLLFMVRIGLAAYPELKRMRRQKVKADAFIAGAFLVGVVLIVIGLERSLLRVANRLGTLHLIIAGAIVLGGSLLTGLLLAFLPKLAIPRTINGAKIDSRYAVDKRLMEIEDHTDPRGEDCIPISG